MPKNSDNSNEMSQKFESYKDTASMPNLSDAYLLKLRR